MADAVASQSLRERSCGKKKVYEQLCFVFDIIFGWQLRWAFLNKILIGVYIWLRVEIIWKCVIVSLKLRRISCFWRLFFDCMGIDAFSCDMQTKLIKKKQIRFMKSSVNITIRMILKMRWKHRDGFLNACFFNKLNRVNKNLSLDIIPLCPFFIVLIVKKIEDQLKFSYIEWKWVE